jgi:hypothetical protein
MKRNHEERQARQDIPSFVFFVSFVVRFSEEINFG